MGIWSLVLKFDLEQSALGAAAACAIPNAPTKVLRIQKMVPLWIVLVGYTVYDTTMLSSTTSTTGHAAHLAGSLFGVAYYYYVLRDNLPFIQRYRFAKTPGEQFLS